MLELLATCSVYYTIVKALAVHPVRVPRPPAVHPVKVTSLPVGHPVRVATLALDACIHSGLILVCIDVAFA